jgi:hypothetical protein
LFQTGMLRQATRGRRVGVASGHDDLLLSMPGVRVTGEKKIRLRIFGNASSAGSALPADTVASDTPLTL